MTDHVPATTYDSSWSRATLDDIAASRCIAARRSATNSRSTATANRSLTMMASMLLAIACVPAFAATLSGLELNLVGDAEQIGDRIRVTPDTPVAVGAAWIATQYDLHTDTHFVVNFALSIAPERMPGPRPDGDGAMLVLHRDPRGAGARGCEGGCLGARFIVPGVGIGPDTYADQAWNPEDASALGLPHIQIDDLSNPNSLALSTALKDLTNGEPIFLQVEYTGAQKSLSVRGGRTGYESLTPLMSTTLDLTQQLGGEGPLWIGWTAATGVGASDAQYLDDASIAWQSHAPPVPLPGALWLFTSAVSAAALLRRPHDPGTLNS